MIVALAVIAQPSLGASDSSTALSAIVDAEKHAREAKCDLSTVFSARDALVKSGALDQLARRTIREQGCYIPEAKVEACDSVLTPKLAQIDNDNSGIVKEVARLYGWPSRSRFGADAGLNAWLIVQHADGLPEFQQGSLDMLNEAVSKGEAHASQAAYLDDWIAVHSGHPQRYGTQGKCDAGEWHLDPVADPDALDARRKAEGLEPFEDYKKRIVELCARATTAPGETGKQKTP